MILQGLKDKKLRGQIVAREKLYGQTAIAAAKTEKVSYFVFTRLFVYVAFMHW
jgi:hypothetical protein